MMQVIGESGQLKQRRGFDFLYRKVKQDTVVCFEFNGSVRRQYLVVQGEKIG